MMTMLLLLMMTMMMMRDDDDDACCITSIPLLVVDILLVYARNIVRHGHAVYINIAFEMFQTSQKKYLYILARYSHCN